ncbi:hypothetical protein ACIQC5_13945 [Paenarthrobacter sp. NPDC092416]|uniref:hypothetical protein n=1 Tax=Paenarthrobacter sp. NPDC092416 TaxID=3364386 RepID=UPI00382E77A7
MEHVYVRLTPGGIPIAVVRGQTEWQIAVDPVRWFERVSWWEGSSRMPRGGGRVDVEVWQVQVRLGANPRSALATWELVRDGTGGGWRLRSAEIAAA